jgi:hypothetical protein
MPETIDELVQGGFRLTEKLAKQIVADSKAPFGEIDKEQ